MKIAVAILCVVCAASVLVLLALTHGQFVYPLDDTYITMALAKNLAWHGVMGLTPHEFTFSTSCPLWMALMAFTYLLAGPAWWMAAVLSFAAGVLVLIVIRRVLMASGLDAFRVAMALCVITLLTPVPALALSGMEHLLHIALAALFVDRAARFLGAGSSFRPRELAVILAILAATTLVRYESLFLAGIFTLLLLLRRQWLYAVLTAVAAFLPVVLIGWVSVSQGWSWLPNSLLLKGAAPDVSPAGFLTTIFRVIRLLWMGPHLAALLLLLAIADRWRARAGDRFWTYGRLLIFFAALATVVHLQFASIGWFFRYEAWLMALGVMALFVNGLDVLIWQPRRWAAALALWLVLLPAARRGGDALIAVPRAAYNIFQQQYQMALFLKTYYPGAAIAANDVGAINFLADLRCLDLAGLCDREILRLKRRHAWDSAAMEARAAREQVRMAMVYDSWFDGVGNPRLPSSWIRIARWQASDRRFLGDGTVSFYAVHPGEAPYLERSLREFNGRLPRTVTATIAPEPSALSAVTAGAGTDP
jgi:hypothetical protein